MSSFLLSLLIGYVLGSIPTAHLVVRRARGVDIRNAGSGNVGALNSYLVTRSPFVGAVVLLFDVLKGFAAVELSRAIFGGLYAAAAGAGIGAVLGHNFPVWLKGQGGRGLSTAAGAMLSIDPVVVPLWMLCWGAGYAAVKEVNVGSAIACCLAPAIMSFLPDGVWNFMVPPQVSRWSAQLFIIATMVVILTKLVGPVKEYLTLHRRL